MSKKCTKCGEIKPGNQFFVRNKSTGRLHAQCKICYQIHRLNYQRAHYEKYKDAYKTRAKAYRDKKRQEFRDQIYGFLINQSCNDCGESDIRVLEFDHLDKDKKAFSISQAFKLGKKPEEIDAEIKKCQILCANCHKKRTAKQFNWYKNGGTEQI